MIIENANMSDMISKMSGKNGDYPAFVCEENGERTVHTYRCFASDVKSRAAALKEQGHTCIGIVCRLGYETIVEIFAANLAGLQVVMLSPALSGDQIQNLIMRMDIDCLYGRQGHFDFASGVHDGSDRILFFTSGTGGRRKPVMLSHRNIASDINGSCQLFVLEGDTYTVLPFHHAFGLIVGVFMVYYYGQETFINKNLRTISKALVTEKPHTMFLVPLFVEAFHKQIWRAADKQKSTAKLKAAMALSDQMLKTGLDMREKFFASVLTPFGKNLKYIICGGASLDPFYVKEFRSWGIEILNGYGMTECSPVVSVNRNLHHKDGTVGLGIPEAEFKTAEDEELLIRGPFLMKGYYKDPEITAEAITEDGWYHTGDLGYVDDEGFIHLTGRKKNLIILNTGENISPEELEADVQLDPGVNECLVYEENGKIVVEIFPEEDFMGNATYFDKLIKKINHPRPAYKHMTEIRLREEEFPKNSTHKIIRKNWGKK